MTEFEATKLTVTDWIVKKDEPDNISGIVAITVDQIKVMWPGMRPE